MPEEQPAFRDRRRPIANPASLLLLLAGLMLAGCVASEWPLLTLDQVIPADRSLEGVWESDQVMLELKVADERSYTMTFTDGVGMGGSSSLQLGKLGDLTVADACYLAKPGEPVNPPAHVFAVVRETSPRLSVSMLDPDWLQSYLKKHPSELAFKADAGGRMVLHSPTAELQKFFLRQTTQLQDRERWKQYELKRVPNHKTVATMPTARQTELGVVHQRTGGYTTRPLKRAQLEEARFRDQLPKDADDIQFAEFRYFQAQEGYLSFRASNESCIAYAKAQLADWNRRNPKEARPIELKPIDKARQQAFIDAKKKGLVMPGVSVGPEYRSIPHEVPAPWFTPENIKNGLELDHPKSGIKFWIDTEKGILYREHSH